MQEAQQETELGRSLPSKLVTGVFKPAPLAQTRITLQVLPAAGEEMNSMPNAVIAFFGMAERQFNNEPCTDSVYYS